MQLELCRVIDISLIKTICLSVIIFVAIIAFVPRTVTLIAKVRCATCVTTAWFALLVSAEFNTCSLR